RARNRAAPRCADRRVRAPCASAGSASRRPLLPPPPRRPTTAAPSTSGAAAARPRPESAQASRGPQRAPARRATGAAPCAARGPRPRRGAGPDRSRAMRACAALPCATATRPPSPLPGFAPSECRAPSRPFLQIAPQPPPRAMQIHLHLIDIEAENPRAGRAIDALDVEQDHEAALRLRERSDPSSKPVAELRLLRMPKRIAILARLRTPIRVEKRPRAPQAVETRVTRDREQPFLRPLDRI